MFGFFFRRRRPRFSAFVVRPSSKPVKDLIVRKYCLSDFAACIRIYKENETQRFPKGYLGVFATHLEQPGVLILVAEMNGEVVGTAGIHSALRESMFYYGLSFGMVADARQHSGVGTILLLSRIALLPEPAARWPVFMTCLESSRGFYEQFGFRHIADEPDQTPPVAGSFLAMVDRKLIVQAQKYLRSRQISIEAKSSDVPFKR